ncbi:NAD(+) diphosphatase [Alteromonadaceae bacterium BrNp21-10]|nr:NAD(+) diphosphatase [Alteromonadaceae bacterium BrNp21-10]
MIVQNLKIPADQSAWWFVFSGNQLLQVESTPGVIQACRQELDFIHPYIADAVQVGHYQDSPCYLIDFNAEEPQYPSAELAGLRDLLIKVDIELFHIAARAWQVALFQRTHRFCGQCGSATNKVDWELAVQCHVCQHRCYPRISPCIIVAIRNGKQILLAQGKHHKNDMYSTLAGFVESGESLEQAVHREVMEEVGVKIKNLRYFSSQPWPFPHSLMMGYIADYDSGDITPDGHEIIKADWFDFDNLPHIPSPYSIAGQLIAAAKEQSDR